jgi:hypothetical protein
MGANLFKPFLPEQHQSVLQITDPDAGDFLDPDQYPIQTSLTDAGLYEGAELGLKRKFSFTYFLENFSKFFSLVTKNLTKS